MEREQLEQLLASDEAKAILSEKFVPKADFDAVANKKEKLLSEKKKVQEKYTELEKQAKAQGAIFEQIGQLGYDPEEVISKALASVENPGTATGGDDKVKKELEGRMQVQKQTYEAKITSLSQEYERKLQDLQEELQHTTNGWYTEKIENTLNAEMDRISVAPKHKNILKAAFRNKSKVVTYEDGVRNVVVLNDDGIEISATEFFNNFKETDDGKEYILAPVTSGGGALGSKNRRGGIDFAAERRKALQEKDTRSSVAAAMAQFQNKR